LAVNEAGFVEVEMKKPAYRSGYLLFAQFDSSGRLLEARRGGLFLSLHRHDAALKRWLGTDEGPGDPPGPIYQFQLLVESHAPLNVRDQAEVRSLFVQALESVRASARRDP
jgi:hypothetical protein